MTDVKPPKPPFDPRRGRRLLLVAIVAGALMMAAVILYAVTDLPAWVLVLTFVLFVAAILRAIWYGLHGLS